MAYLASEIGSDGGANSGNSVAGLSSTALNVSAGRSPGPGMNGSSELTCATSLKSARPSAARLQHVERGVGVAGQAIARHAVDHALGHELRHDVEAGGEQIGGGVGVIGGDVILLRHRHMQPSPGEEEELDDADVWRQAAGAQRRGIGEIGIAAEQAIDHGRDEAAFEEIGGLRLLQCQRGEESEIDRAVGGRTGIERVDDVVGLAEPERQPDHELSADIADDVICDCFGIGENLWHRSKACGNSGTARRN